MSEQFGLRIPTDVSHKRHGSFVDIGSQLEIKQDHLLESDSETTRSVISPTALHSGKKRFGKVIFETVQSTKRARQRLAEMEQKIEKLKQAKAKQEANILKLQKYEERLDSKRQQHREWQNQLEEKKLMNDIATSQKREKIRKDTEERKQRLEKAKQDALGKKVHDASEMRETNNKLKQIAKEKQNKELQEQIAKVHQVDEYARNTREYHRQQEEEKREKRRQEMEQIVKDHLEEREMLIAKRQELKIVHRQLVSGIRNAKRKRTTLGTRLEEKVRDVEGYAMSVSGSRSPGSYRFGGRSPGSAILAGDEGFSRVVKMRNSDSVPNLFLDKVDSPRPDPRTSLFKKDNEEDSNPALIHIPEYDESQNGNLTKIRFKKGAKTSR